MKNNGNPYAKYGKMEQKSELCVLDAEEVRWLRRHRRNARMRRKICLAVKREFIEWREPIVARITGLVCVLIGGVALYRAMDMPSLTLEDGEYRFCLLLLFMMGFCLFAAPKSLIDNGGAKR